MAIDRGVLSSIAGLVERDPASVALRMHLAELLLDDGQASEALVQVSQVLATRPDDLNALELGARAAEAAGETSRADSYRRMSAALAAPSLPDPRSIPAEPPPLAPAADESRRDSTSVSHKEQRCKQTRSSSPSRAPRSASSRSERMVTAS
jgi:hypothetical protein